jgi:hypothetical protein
MDVTAFVCYTDNHKGNRVAVSKQQLQKVMTKQMSRRDFIKHLGLVVVGILGINSFLSLLADPQHSPRVRQSRGWGNGKFGK